MSVCVYLFILFLSLLKYRFGRDNFQEAMKVVHRRDIDIDWTKLKFMVFDIPTHSGTYEERYKTLGKT